MLGVRRKSRREVHAYMCRDQGVKETCEREELKLLLRVRARVKAKAYMCVLAVCLLCPPTERERVKCVHACVLVWSE